MSAWRRRPRAPGWCAYSGDAAAAGRAVPRRRLWPVGTAIDLAGALGDCSADAVADHRQPDIGRRAADHGRGHGTGTEAAWLTSCGFLPGMGGLVTFALAGDHRTRATLPRRHQFFGAVDSARQPAVAIGGTGADDPAFTRALLPPVGRRVYSPVAASTGCYPHRSALAARLRSTSPAGLAAVLRFTARRTLPGPGSLHRSAHRPADHHHAPLSAVSPATGNAHRSSADQSRKPDASPGGGGGTGPNLPASEPRAAIGARRRLGRKHAAFRRLARHRMSAADLSGAAERDRGDDVRRVHARRERAGANGLPRSSTETIGSSGGRSPG